MSNDARKQFIRDTFNTVAEGYDSPALDFFQKSAALLPQYFAFEGREHVLDATSGTGAAALNLAAALPRGKVSAVDMSEGMLAQAKNKALDKGLSNIEFSVMDVENLQFPNEMFDHINCSFGLFFLEDMQGLLKHLLEKLKPGGKFMSCCFTEEAFQPHADLFYERIKKYGVEIPETIGFKRLASVEKSKTLYESANLKNIQTYQHDVGCLQKNAEEWWDVVWYAGFRGFVNQLDQDALARFKREHLAEVSRLSNGEGIPFKVDVIFTIGEK